MLMDDVVNVMVWVYNLLGATPTVSLSKAGQSVLNILLVSYCDYGV